MTSRLLFSLAILGAAVAYTYIAFTELSFTIRGRLGPGFFPRTIGVILIAFMLYSIFHDVRREQWHEHPSHYMRDLVVFFGYCLGFVFLLPVLGGLLSMVAFMLAALFTFNRGRVVTNLIVSVAPPVVLYVLFHVWLHAAFAEGRFQLPW